MTLKKALVFEGLRNMLMADEKLDILSSPNIQGFHFNRDLGVRSTTMEFGKEGGWSGNYRWFELYKDQVNLNFVFFNLHKPEDFTKKPVNKKRRRKVEKVVNYQETLCYSPKELFIVGRGNASKQQISLLLEFEKDIVGKPNKKVHCFHDGDLTLWKHYRIKGKDVMNNVKASVPMLRNRMNDLVLLGKITERKNFSINDEDIADMLLRLAIYAHLLHVFRDNYE